MAQYTKDPFYKHSVIKRFNEVASKYEENAYLAEIIGEELINRLNDIECQPKSILDLGGGGGRFSRILARQFPEAEVYNLDAAFDMLKYSEHHFSENQKSKNQKQRRIISILAEAENLPFRDASFDVVFCNCLFYCLESPGKVLTEIKRILKPRAVLLFSSLGRESLKELRSCFERVDEGLHVNSFPEMHHFGDDLISIGFDNPVMDREELVFSYQTLNGILKDIRNSGENVVFGRESGGLKTPRYFQKMKELYESYRDENQELPVTIEVIYGYALGAENLIQNASDTDYVNYQKSKHKKIKFIEI